MMAAVLATSLTACSSWFDPSTDDVVDPVKLNNRTAVATLLAGARFDFALAYVGGGDGVQEGTILTSGLVADEFDNSDTFPTRQEMDQRAMDVRNASLLGVYANLHRARAAADAAAAKARELTPDDPDTIAELHSIAGLSILSFADNYCSGVPLSALKGSDLVFGAQQTTAQLYAAAIAKFDSALAISPSLPMASMARVGKGRALLGLGRFAEIAAVVGPVPTGFRLTTFHSEVTGPTSNGVFAFVNLASRWSVSPGTGGGIDFAQADDPRVPVEFTGGPGFDAFTPQFNQLLYPNLVAPVPVVTGREARLMEGEAQLRAGQSGQALGILNGLREPLIK